METDELGEKPTSVEPIDPPFKYLALHQGCLNRTGVAIIQAGHALEESVRVLPVSNQTTYSALQAKTSDDLIEFARQLTAIGVDHIVINEPDAPWNGTVTAVATVAIPRSEAQVRIRPITERLGFTRIR